MVYVPLIFLILIPLELIGGMGLGSEGRRWGRFLTDVICLGTIHSVISFTMMAFLPELRNWARELGQGSEWRFWRRVLAVATFFGVFFFFSVQRAKGDPEVLLLIFFVVDSCFGLRHWVQQTKGVSLHYNHQLRQSGELTESELQELATGEKVERHLFTAVCYLTIAAAMSASGSHWSSGFFKFWYTEVLFAFALIAAVALLVNAISLKKFRRTYKLPYLMRALYIPFHPVSVFGNLSMRAIHGLEFLVVAQKMTKNSSLSQRNMKLFVLFTVAAVGFAGLCTAAKKPIFGNYLEYNWFTIALLTLNSTFTYTHYYADAVMFRFKSGASRDHVAPMVNRIPA